MEYCTFCFLDRCAFSFRCLVLPFVVLLLIHLSFYIPEGSRKDSSNNEQYDPQNNVRGVAGLGIAVGPPCRRRRCRAASLRCGRSAVPAGSVGLLCPLRCIDHDGLLFPVSHLLTVVNDTPIACAKASWLIKLRCLMLFTSFEKLMSYLRHETEHMLLHYYSVTMAFLQ